MGKPVIIFGADGQLGFDLSRVLVANYSLTGFNRAQADITDYGLIAEIINQKKPAIVINATAYNKVEAAEQEKDLAFEVNAEAVGHLASIAKQSGAVLIHVSSDYVFAGDKDFFIETDEPQPLNVYGQSKLAGEEKVKSLAGNYYLIRTSSVFGTNEGKQKMNFVDQIVAKARQGQVMRIVNDQIMSPTFSYDLAVKIKQLLEKPAPFGIYHITNQGSCSWYEFAKKILELMNIQAEVVAISTGQSGTKVNRPKTSILKNAALEKLGLAPMPPWQDALRRYLKEKYK